MKSNILFFNAVIDTVLICFAMLFSIAFFYFWLTLKKNNWFYSIYLLSNFSIFFSFFFFIFFSFFAFIYSFYLSVIDLFLELSTFFYSSFERGLFSFYSTSSVVSLFKKVSKRFFIIDSGFIYHVLGFFFFLLLMVFFVCSSEIFL